MTIANAGVLELADEVDSKSIGGDTVRVRPPPPAPRKTRQVFPVWSFFDSVISKGVEPLGCTVKQTCQWHVCRCRSCGSSSEWFREAKAHRPPPPGKARLRSKTCRPPPPGKVRLAQQDVSTPAVLT